VSDDYRVDLNERRLREAHRGASPRGTRLLTAILPDGRIVRLAVATPLAPAATVNRVARLAEDVAEWQCSATDRQRGAIERLMRQVADDAGRLSAAKVERAGALGRRIVTRYEKLDGRVTTAVDEFRSRVERQVKVEVETARRLGRRDLWDKIVIASSLPLFAAYGQPGQPFSTTNLALTLSLLIWLVGDQVVEAVFGSEEKSIYPWRDTDIWSYLAPIGNLLTGWWLFGDRQNERFVTGVTPVTLAGDPNTPGKVNFHQSLNIDLSRRVASEHWPDFETFKGVPVVATVSSTRLSAGIGATVRGLGAVVERGKLLLSFDVVAAPLASGETRPASFGEVDIAWIVDTAEPPATKS
jgi:hypothetical protein